MIHVISSGYNTVHRQWHTLWECLLLCLWYSRFHVVSLQDGLDRQVAHAWVFGEVALGSELVLQHLGKVPDILPWCSLERERAQRWLCSLRGCGAQTPFRTCRSSTSGPFDFKVNALIVKSECAITVTRKRKQIYDSQPGFRCLYFSPGTRLKKSLLNHFFTSRKLHLVSHFREVICTISDFLKFWKYLSSLP